MKLGQDWVSRTTNASGDEVPANGPAAPVPCVASPAGVLATNDEDVLTRCVDGRNAEMETTRRPKGIIPPCAPERRAESQEKQIVRVYECVCEGFGNSRVISEITGIQANAVSAWLSELQAAGLIERDGISERSARLRRGRDMYRSRKSDPRSGEDDGSEP